MERALTWWKDLEGIEKGTVVALSLIALLMAASFASREGKPDDLTTEARVTCHAHVRQYLKAPSTADFNSDDRESGGPQGPWKITGTVDSENGFGAKVRSGWTCDIAKTPDGWDVSVNVR